MTRAEILADWHAMNDAVLAQCHSRHLAIAPFLEASDALGAVTQMYSAESAIISYLDYLTELLDLMLLTADGEILFEWLKQANVQVPEILKDMLDGD